MTPHHNLINKQLQYTLTNISRSKNKQTMKLGQLIEYNKKMFLFENYAKNKAGKLVPDLFYLLKKLNIW